MNVLLVKPNDGLIRIPSFVRSLINLKTKLFSRHSNEMLKNIDVKLRTSSFSISQPSYGLLSIASTLRKHDISVSYLQLENDDSRWKKELGSAIDDADIVGITCYTPNYPQALSVARRVRDKSDSILLVMGGPHVTFRDKDAIQDGIDIVVRGEGEKSILEIVRRFKNRKDLSFISDIPGCTTMIDGKLLRTKIVTPSNSNLDVPPAWDLLSDKNKIYTKAVLFTSRGCSYNCAFCSETNMFGNYRTRSIDNILADVEITISELDTNYIHIEDSTFTQDNNHARRVAHALHSNFPEVYFSCEVRSDCTDEKTLECLASNNFIRLYVGVEHCSPSILYSMRKGETFSQQREFLKKASKKIPFILISWLVGFPGESFETIKDSCMALKELYDIEAISDCFPRPLVPYPGTSIFKNREKYGIEILTMNWERFGRLSYPCIFRLGNLTEYEIYAGFLQILTVSLSCLLRREGILNSTESWSNEIEELCEGSIGHLYRDKI